MNLLGRLFLVCFGILFRAKPSKQLHTAALHFRVWPHDIDINGHLTASRYFSFGDLGRLNWMIQNNVFKDFVNLRFRGVVNAQEMTYIREFKPFARVELQVDLAAWDDKYTYFEQRYYHKGKLFSVGHARVCLLKGRKVFPPKQFIALYGREAPNVNETPAVAAWKQTLNAKRDQFS